MNRNANSVHTTGFVFAVVMGVSLAVSGCNSPVPAVKTIAATPPVRTAARTPSETKGARMAETNVKGKSKAADNAKRKGQTDDVANAGGVTRQNPLDLIGKVNGRGWYLPWYARDPKKPNGPPVPILIAEAETGEITKHNENPEIVMRHVHARLFQKGVHAANVDAAKIRANQQERTVFGSGGCTVKSLINPADTVLTADRITWDTANTIFIAEGHAHVIRRPRDGGLPITQEGGKIIYDLEHNTVTIL